MKIYRTILNLWKESLFWQIITLFLLFTLITLFIFNHRLPNILTQYGMPDIDTDGGLWYQWYLHYIKTHQLVYDIANVAGYPLGYDISASPASNLVFSVQLFIMEHISGFSLKNLIFITNLSSLITYPLSAIGGYLLCYYFTRDKYSSFIAGLIFGFSF